ncbi:GNAT family N-acetyltransferase [Maribacter sp. LLG6340-A2]|uniref:GNAT family N-acetyltransferase n=1 Tax=Maribacter sp. LLG6340-A2 TaxID=3160834 RepID=UPI00386BDFAA
MYTIDFIKNENLGGIIPFLELLNPKIGKVTLKERLNEMIAQNYQCIGVYDGGKLIGISGIWVLTKYYIGKHVEPDNVCILPEYQGKGIGRQLSDWIFDYAKSIGCEAAELNCYLGNVAGHKFWEQQGYEKVAYHFQKKNQLDEQDI